MPEPPNPDFYDPAWDDWDEKGGASAKRALVGALIALLLIGTFVAYTKYHSSSNGLSKSVTPTTFVVAQPRSAPPIQHFSGTVSGSTGKFVVGEGANILNARCACISSRFQIQVVDSNGSIVSTPVSTIGYYGTGQFSGSVPLPLSAGTYSFSVLGIGKWSIAVQRPPADLPSLSPGKRSYGGSGPEVIGPFRARPQFSVIWGLPVVPTPANLQVMDAVSGVVSTVATSSGSTKPLFISVPAQQDNFYICISDVPSLWGLLVP